MIEGRKESFPKTPDGTIKVKTADAIVVRVAFQLQSDSGSVFRSAVIVIDLGNYVIVYNVDRNRLVRFKRRSVLNIDGTGVTYDIFHNGCFFRLYGRHCYSRGIGERLNTSMKIS